MSRALILLCMVTVQALSFGIIRPGTRAAGMGGAFIALSDDAWAIWWNPAGILRSQQSLLGTEYANLYPALDQGSLHFASISYIHPFSQFVAVSAGVDYLTSNDLYTEGEACLGFSFRPGIFPVSIGLVGKYMLRQFANNEFTSYDPLFAQYGYRGSGIGLDLGIQAELGRTATLAAVVRNLTQPDLGLECEDKIPMEFLISTAFYPKLLTPVLQVKYGIEKVGDSEDLDFCIGFERWLGSTSNWGVRTGYTIEDAGAAQSISAGFSARYEGSVPMELDYAFSYPFGDLGCTWGRHRLGVVFRLGGESWEEDLPRVPLPPMVDTKEWTTEVDMYRFNLWANRDITEETLTIAQYDQIPVNSYLQLDENVNLYAYFPATASFSHDDIKDLTAYFRVSRLWLEENNLELRLVRLYRVQEDNSLERMPSAMIDEDIAYYYYETSLDDISDFIISGRAAELVMLEPRTVYGDVDSIDILEASLQFRVSKLWIDENRIDPSTIGLSRVRGGIPLDIECRLINEDLEYLYYETDPIDLFQFVIIAMEREGLPVANIYFDYNNADLRSDQISELDRVIETLRANPGVFVSVEGHADSDGTFSYNDGLSEDRALLIREYLEQRLEGYEIEIEASWFGERRPAAANDTEEGRMLNRRVEIVTLRRN